MADGGERLNGPALAAIGAGVLFAYAGLKGYSVLASVRALISGQAPATTGQANPITGISTGGGGGGGSAAAGDTGAHSGTASGNQAIARMLTARYGWSQGQQWDDLVSLWNQESGWSNTADNSSSGAYGIPQALPFTKMPKAAWPPSHGGSADPTVQITWGLSYIKDRYGSPSAAWAHEISAGWY